MGHFRIFFKNLLQLTIKNFIFSKCFEKQEKWSGNSDEKSHLPAQYRWYAELFYFNPKNGRQGRRGNDPVGHLTQLLWPESTKVGCGTAVYAVKQPPNTVPSVLLSSYTVCHYSPQGNIIGLIEDKFKPLDVSFYSKKNKETSK